MAATRSASARALFVHLRLHYQIVFLSPLFAWGFVLGGRQFSTRAGLGFLAFHVFLYGGITAYNSYYDRDEGPVGGLWHPPPVEPALHGFSWLVQVIGLLLAAEVGASFTLLYLLVMGLSVAYSHPRWRWKARPLLSLLVVALGQGAVGFAGGWLCGSTPSRPLLSSYEGWLGLTVAALVTVGLYPLTQLYQIAEDRSRGDTTFAVVFGPTACFRFAFTCVALGGACMTVLAARLFGAFDALLLVAGQVLLLSQIVRWQRRFRSEVATNFLTLHRLQTAVSLATLGYITARLWMA